MNRTLSIFLSVIIGTILILGAILYWQRSVILEKEQTKSDLTTGMKTKGETVNIQVLLKETPGPNASPESLKEFASKVEKAAKESRELNISRCIPDPAILKIPSGSTYVVRNTDSVVHTLYIARQNAIEIPAQSEKRIVANFGSGQGSYVYACDAPTNFVGIFLVR